MTNELVNETTIEEGMIRPMSVMNPEVYAEFLESVGEEPDQNLRLKRYLILFLFTNANGVDDTAHIIVNSRAELRQTIIDNLKAAESVGSRLDIDNSFVLPEGWTINFDEDWASIYDVMKQIEPYFEDDERYEPFDIDEWV